jgi:hypothetical protein
MKIRLRDRLGSPAGDDILIDTKKIRGGSAALSIDPHGLLEKGADAAFVVTVFSGKDGDHILEHRSSDPDQAERIYLRLKSADDAYGPGWMNVGD